MRCYKENIQVSNCASSITLNKPFWEHNNSTLKRIGLCPCMPHLSQLCHLHSSLITCLLQALQLCHAEGTRYASAGCPKVPG